MKVAEGIEYLESPPAAYQDGKIVEETYSHLRGFRALGKDELPVDVKWGVRYDTVVINSPVYCAWLLRRFVLRGGRVMVYSLSNLLEAFWLMGEKGKVNSVVNCSGMGFGDTKSFIIRGEWYFFFRKIKKEERRKGRMNISLKKSNQVKHASSEIHAKRP